jgi:polyisoprenoid-binding protein YceI
MAPAGLIRLNCCSIKANMNSKSILSLLLAAALPLLAQETWTIDTSHSSAQFAVRHMMVSTVRGTLGKITGTVKFDPKNLPASSVEASIDASTIDTRHAKRDEDLRGPEFFDVAKYPKMTFQSTKIVAAGKGKYKMTGNLTMRGVTKQVTFDVEGPVPAVSDGKGGRKSGATATARINRREFGLNYNAVIETGGVVVSDEVTITLDIELNQAKAS